MPKNKNEITLTKTERTIQQSIIKGREQLRSGKVSPTLQEAFRKSLQDDETVLKVMLEARGIKYGDVIDEYDHLRGNPREKEVCRWCKENGVTSHTDRVSHFPARRMGDDVIVRPLKIRIDEEGPFYILENSVRDAIDEWIKLSTGDTRERFESLKEELRL